VGLREKGVGEELSSEELLKITSLIDYHRETLSSN